MASLSSKIGPSGFVTGDQGVATTDSPTFAGLTVTSGTGDYTTTGTMTAATFNATSTTNGGFQGIDADTAALPSFTWTADLNTGVWHPAADQVGITTGGTNRVTISSTGLVCTGNVTAYSDERLKTNIQTIGGALDKVKRLRGVSFEKDGRQDIGVVAQEVQAVVPEVVDTAHEYLSVAYGNMVGLLIEAIKEQQQQIDDLKAKLEAK